MSLGVPDWSDDFAVGMVIEIKGHAFVVRTIEREARSSPVALVLEWRDVKPKRRGRPVNGKTFEGAGPGA